MRYMILFLFASVALPAWSADYIALRNLAAQTSLSGNDVQILSPEGQPLEGRETVRFLRKGEKFDQTALKPKAVLERNQLVELKYSKGALDIKTEGRVLDRAALGERVQVMNLASRTIVSGRVTSASVVEVD